MPWYGKGYNDGPEDNYIYVNDPTLKRDNDRLLERVRELEKENRKLKKKLGISVPKKKVSKDIDSVYFSFKSPNWKR